MSHLHHFVWTDLSTYSLDEARAFYGSLMGWQFSGDPNYDFALVGDEPAAAIFPMPDRMRAKSMPSFWMSYIQVNSVEETVAKARRHAGATIEQEPIAFGDGGTIALIRDPAGAGFTVYAGPDLDTGHQSSIGWFHHVDDLRLVDTFYADIFGWTFEAVSQEPWPRYAVRHEDGTPIATVEEIPKQSPNAWRYWMPCFEVNSAKGVEVVSDLGDGRALVVDGQGAHFMVQTDPQTERQKETSSDVPWKAGLALAAMWCAVVFEVGAFWGLLFLFWSWPVIRDSKVHFVERITKDKTPIVYWALASTWVILSVWLIWDDIALWLLF